MRKLVLFQMCPSGLSSHAYEQEILQNEVPRVLREEPGLLAYRMNFVANPRGTEFFPTHSIAEYSFASPAALTSASDAWEDRLAASGAFSAAPVFGYDTTEYLQKAPPAPDLPKGASGRFKMIAILQKPEGQSLEEFRRLWIEQHLPLALEHHGGLSKYVANVVDRPVGPRCFPIDGISELHFPDEETFRSQFYTHPDSRAIIAEDTQKFIGRSCAWFVREYHFR